VTQDTDAYQRLFASHPVAMAIWNPATGRILAVNDAAVSQYGYSRSEAVGMTVDRLIHPDDWPRLRERVASMPPGHVSGETFRHIRRDGSVLEVEMTGHEVDFDGIAARVVMAADVTERRSLEERLRQAQRMEAVGQLAGGIAHDFNNLLMVINGFSEVLVGRLPDGDELDAAQQIRMAGERAANLTRQLLAFASPGMQRPEIVDLVATIDGLLPMLERALGEHVEVRVEREARDPWVETDRAQLEQVIVNLAVNARDAMPDGGRLTLEVRDAPSDLPEAIGAPQGALLLSIRDTGRGIGQELRERVFLPFFTTKADRGGSGLGLATVFATVRGAGGRVWVEGNDGPGTTIRVLLPRAAEPPPEERPATHDETTGPERRGVVLVADDEGAVRTLIERVLRGAGYEVVTAAHGGAAMDVADARLADLDLLVTDAVMPGVTGLQLARRVRVRRPDLPVLFISGWASDAFEQEWRSEPRVDLLLKPFSVGELLGRVAALAGSGAPPAPAAVADAVG
jgi:PAS domain S-box-containing protein